jgi:hypothetical protein
MTQPIVLHYPAILAATLASFLLGGLWYSPVLFGRRWMNENGPTSETVQQRRHPAVIFGGSFVLTLIMALNLGAFLSGPASLAWGAEAGLLAGAGWVALALGVTYLFERKSLSLFFINAGFHAVSFTLMGAIIGAWK